ncbi:MAG: FAD-dependent oxidoreductase, partial [Rhodoferax sp.]|nr:FAD-dependent oxidoreductase [Rhodoferax sp.]
YANDKVSGVRCQDQLTGKTYQIESPCVVNATGVWVDQLRQKDSQAVPGQDGRATQPMVAPSQGVHMVVEHEFLDADVAMMVPKTADGRVLFAVPWLGKVILGTTDTPRHDLAREPLAFDEEIEFILSESAKYLRRAPKRADVKSIWVGLRPLVKPPEDEGSSTKGLSREHTILVSRSGLVTVTGGKWTTYRAMAEDVLEKCTQSRLIGPTQVGVTKSLRLLGSSAPTAIPPMKVRPLFEPPGWHSYGAEQAFVKTLPGANDQLCAGLCSAMVRFAARYEYAVTVEDVLARRSRLLFLDARLAGDIAPRVGEILSEEGQMHPEVAKFQSLATNYLLQP